MKLQPKEVFSASRKDLRLFGILLTPSWMSALTVVIIGLVVVVGTIGELHYKNSGLQQLFASHSQASTSLSSTSTTIETQSEKSTLVNNLPLLVFWGGIGLIAYFVTISIINSLSNIVGLGQEMNYVNVNRRQLLESVFIRFLIRIASLGLWILWVNYTIDRIFPFALALTYSANNGLGGTLDAIYLVGAVAIVAACLQLHIIFLRLLVLRPRVFGGTILT